MACGICNGTLNPCPVCHTWAAPKDPHESWEERLDSRRHKGSHETPYVSDTNPPPAAYGLYSIDNGADRTGPKYDRSFNSKYDGPGKGTW